MRHFLLSLIISLFVSVGQAVSQESVVAFGGLDTCFVSEPISDALWTKMQGKTYKPNPYIGRQDLRHIRVLHWDYDKKIHAGELVCNKKIADKLVSIFRQLFEQRYPIERMVLPEEYDADDEKQMRANNTSCFCYRPIAGSSKLSKHSLGLAIDINPLYNPYYKVFKDGTRFVQPATAKIYCNRKATFPYKIDHKDLCYRLFKANGFQWGGDWRSSKDYQHFEL